MRESAAGHFVGPYLYNINKYDDVRVLLLKYTYGKIGRAAGLF